MSKCGKEYREKDAEEIALQQRKICKINDPPKKSYQRNYTGTKKGIIKKRPTNRVIKVHRKKCPTNLNTEKKMPINNTGTEKKFPKKQHWYRQRKESLS